MASGAVVLTALRARAEGLSTVAQTAVTALAAASKAMDRIVEPRMTSPVGVCGADSNPSPNVRLGFVKLRAPPRLRQTRRRHELPPSRSESVDHLLQRCRPPERKEVEGGEAVSHHHVLVCTIEDVSHRVH